MSEVWSCLISQQMVIAEWREQMPSVSDVTDFAIDMGS